MPRIIKQLNIFMVRKGVSIKQIYSLNVEFPMMYVYNEFFLWTRVSRSINSSRAIEPIHKENEIFNIIKRSTN